ncbi:MAG: hypothetical protein LIP12_12525 [Clostridiales bacterium]|nr:hypothetical protein [Clostridiales bacterium]
MKISQILYRIWLAALAILVVVCSLEQSPVLIDGTVRTTCFAMLGMLVLLGLWQLIPGTSIKDEMPAVENAHRATTAAGDAWNRTSGQDGARLPAAWRRAAAFALVAVLYWCYCFRMSGWISTNSKMDALVAGGLICAAVVLSGGGFGQRDLRHSDL